MVYVVFRSPDEAGSPGSPVKDVSTRTPVSLYRLPNILLLHFYFVIVGTLFKYFFFIPLYKIWMKNVVQVFEIENMHI